MEGVGGIGVYDIGEHRGIGGIEYMYRLEGVGGIYYNQNTICFHVFLK